MLYLLVQIWLINCKFRNWKKVKNQLSYICHFAWKSYFNPILFRPAIGYQTQRKRRIFIFDANSLDNLKNESQYPFRRENRANLSLSNYHRNTYVWDTEENRRKVITISDIIWLLDKRGNPLGMIKKRISIKL